MKGGRDLATFWVLLILASSFTTLAFGKATRYYDWKIEYTNVTRLCHTKSLVSVNGQFPGPTLKVREGDRIIVNVTNLVNDNVTIHWHGVRQLLSSWADGPAYITQCPIQKGASFVHNFTIVGQRGTLFWHAHISWLRATLYGAFIIRPKKNGLYPFRNPVKEIPVILGEWWNADVEAVITEALNAGGAYNISDALTIDGQPGALYNCSEDDVVKHTVKANQTYLIRLINAAMNFDLYFAVANHSVTVVEADAEYTLPYTTDVVMLTPGQTSTLVLNTTEAVGNYLMAATVYSPASFDLVPFPTIPTTAILRYEGADHSINASALPLPTFPVFNDTTFAMNFLQALKSRSFSEGYYYMDVPITVDYSLLYTVGYATKVCPPTATEACPGPNGQALWAAVNNVSFASPTTSVLQAFYNQIANVYETDFPDKPEVQYNYTGTQPANLLADISTKVKVIPFNASVEIVFQNTATLFFESHPMHLHGQNFWIVGSGIGTFNNETDPANFNFENPISRSTVAVPSGGWAAVRWRALNPGVWFLHCHLDIHASWGMMMAFIVPNGNGPSATLPPPPPDMPPC